MRETGEEREERKGREQERKRSEAKAFVKVESYPQVKAHTTHGQYRGGELDPRRSSSREEQGEGTIYDYL